MMNILLSSAYLAPIQYYSKLYHAETAVVEQFDHYQKQTYRNRCVIASPNGPQALTIPVEKPGGDKCLMRDVRISDHGRWRHLHWNALESTYRNSPFFDYYADDFRPFYEKKYSFLVDFNEEIQQVVLRLLDLDSALSRSSEYRVHSSGFVDYREVISPKFKGGDNEFELRPYYQVFSQKHGFLPNLSIVDLLFNMGPESLLVVRDSFVSASPTL